MMPIVICNIYYYYSGVFISNEARNAVHDLKIADPIEYANEKIGRNLLLFFTYE
jgi:hypothetical protein